MERREFSLPGLCDDRGHVKPVTCLEVSPPKDEEGWRVLFDLVERTRRWSDCLAMADVGSQRGTQAIAAAVRLRRETGLPVIAHITCANRASDDFLRDADALVRNGIDHALILRGDPPRATGIFQPPPCGFAHADDAIRFLVERRVPLTLGAACYPGGHPEDQDAGNDKVHVLNRNDVVTMRRKVGAGARFLVTQALLSHEPFNDHRFAAARANLAVPIMACILALDSQADLHAIATRCQIPVPDKFLKFRGDEPSGHVLQEMIGIARASWVVGASGLHICTFNNRPKSAERTERLLRELFEPRHVAHRDIP